MSTWHRSRPRIGVWRSDSTPTAAAVTRSAFSRCRMRISCSAILRVGTIGTGDTRLARWMRTIAGERGAQMRGVQALPRRAGAARAAAPPVADRRHVVSAAVPTGVQRGVGATRGLGTTPGPRTACRGGRISFRERPQPGVRRSRQASNGSGRLSNASEPGLTSTSTAVPVALPGRWRHDGTSARTMPTCRRVARSAIEGPRW